MLSDFWFILADNILYGFEVDMNGMSGNSTDNSVQMKLEVQFGPENSKPLSAVAYKGEVS